MIKRTSSGRRFWSSGRRIVCAGIVFVCTSLLQGCGLPLGVYTWLQTKRYSGDGVIKNCSNMFASGYMITFPAFDSASHHQVTYRFVNVPYNLKVFPHSEPFLYLCFPESASPVDVDYLRNRTTASIKVTLSKESGSISDSFELPLSSMIWGQGRDLYGRNLLFKVFHPGKSTLHFDRDTAYRLKVDYTPGTVPPPAARLFLVIDACASGP